MAEDLSDVNFEIRAALYTKKNRDEVPIQGTK
jgi:hypothetical protein